MEEVIDLAAKDVVKLLTVDGPRIANRPYGSKPLSSQEIHQDWLANKDDANYWADRLKKAAVTKGPLNAMKELLDWDRRMRSKTDGST